MSGQNEFSSKFTGKFSFVDGVTMGALRHFMEKTKGLPDDVKVELREDKNTDVEYIYVQHAMQSKHELPNAHGNYG